jgi:probable HAF family extracellular repeat protein
MHDLGTLGGDYSTAYGINASGQVVGHSGIVGNAQTHAFIYTGTPGGGGVMRDLGTLGGSGSGATAINASGQVVGNSALEGDVTAHAFLYTGTPGSGGVIHDLDLPGGSYSIAWAINSFGQVVGRSDDIGAFLYTGTPGAGGSMINLNAWLDAHNPVEGAKWSLHEAVGITDTGLIAGNGYYDDGTVPLGEGFRAFLLDASSFVPEPSCIVFLGVAVPAILCLRRRPTLSRAARAAPVFAMMPLLLVQTSRAGVIATPPGLVEGEKFRIAFVTSAAWVAESSNIADYDRFVEYYANLAGLTYNGDRVSWQVIASTWTVNAVDSGRLPLTSNAGIYRVDGVKVADNAADLWDGNLDAPIVLDEMGSTKVSLVWTGTGPNGRAIEPLGLEEANWGNSPSSDGNWMYASTSLITTWLPMYGISEELSVVSVPEPSAFSLCGLVAFLGLLMGPHRRRQASRRCAAPV